MRKRTFNFQFNHNKAEILDILLKHADWKIVVIILYRKSSSANDELE